VNEFLHRHAGCVIGCLSGFDRLLFRGTVRLLASASGLMSYLWSARVPLKDFGEWSAALTARVRGESEAVMRDAGRPLLYLNDPSASKEELARSIARRDRVEEGPVCLLSAVEPCWSFEVRRDRAAKKLVLEPRYRKCLHLYHYRVDGRVGLTHVRLQTWLPFGLRVCLNGREWLCRQLDRDGVGYDRRDNCLARVSDARRAQELLDGQLRTDWPALLNRLADRAHPGRAPALPLEGRPLEPYWSTEQSEWATDVMFRDAASLAAVYPKLVRHGITTLGCGDVLRFLGKKAPAHGGPDGRFAGEAGSDLRRRPEGTRLKHRVNGNSVKVYDKQGSVLRVETTVNDPRQFKAYRGTEANPRDKAWRPLRKGVADLYRRAAVSRASNDRYLAALAAVECPRTLAEATAPLCRAVTRDGRRYRALRPLHEPDTRLLKAAADGRWAVNGLRNADVRRELFGADAKDVKENRRRSGRVTRQLAMLRAHGLLRRVPKTRRWLLTDKGRQITALLSAAQDASAETLLAAAA
jgi:hypothetical protein